MARVNMDPALEVYIERELKFVKEICKEPQYPDCYASSFYFQDRDKVQLLSGHLEPEEAVGALAHEIFHALYDSPNRDNRYVAIKQAYIIYNSALNKVLMGQFTANSPQQKQKLIDAVEDALVRYICSKDAGYIRPIDKENELTAFVAASLYDFGLPETGKDSISTDEWSRLVDKLESDTFSADDFVRAFQYLVATKADEVSEKQMEK